MSLGTSASVLTRRGCLCAQGEGHLDGVSCDSFMKRWVVCLCFPLFQKSLCKWGLHVRWSNHLNTAWRWQPCSFFRVRLCCPSQDCVVLGLFRLTLTLWVNFSTKSLISSIFSSLLTKSCADSLCNSFHLLLLGHHISFLILTFIYIPSRFV